MRKPVFYIEIIALVTTAITALGACTRDSTLIWDFSSSNMALSENKPTASDPAAMQYLAPYSGVAMGEHCSGRRHAHRDRDCREEAGRSPSLVRTMGRGRD